MLRAHFIPKFQCQYLIFLSSCHIGGRTLLSSSERGKIDKGINCSLTRVFVTWNNRNKLRAVNNWINWNSNLPNWDIKWIGV